MTASASNAMESTAPSEFISIIPWDFAREHLVLSHGTDADGCEQLWVADGTPWFVLHNIGVRLNRPVATETVDAAFLAQRIDDMYRVSGADTLISLDERSESDGLELVIEEAGQFSLANTVAVSRAARNLLLLGDPQQLPQVSQGTHPEPVDGSALGWLIDGLGVEESLARRIPDDQPTPPPPGSRTARGG